MEIEMAKVAKINERKTDTLPEGMRRRIVECKTRQVDEERRTITFFASTEVVARDGGIIAVNGWELDNFKRNPVFLWSHASWELPLGRVIEVKKVTRPKDDLGKRLEITVEFAGLEQLHEKAETVFALYRDGFLSAVSVGYRPMEFAELTDDQKEKMGLSKYGHKVLKAELYEVSAVSVPADPEALISREVDGEEAREALLSVRSIAREEDLEGIDRLVASLEGQESREVDDENIPPADEPEDIEEIDDLDDEVDAYEDMVLDRLEVLEAAMERLAGLVEKAVRAIESAPESRRTEAVPAEEPTDEPTEPSEDDDEELYAIVAARSTT